MEMVSVRFENLRDDGSEEVEKREDSAEAEEE
jgi:hypothetical protein